MTAAIGDGIPTPHDAEQSGLLQEQRRGEAETGLSVLASGQTKPRQQWRLARTGCKVQPAHADIHSGTVQAERAGLDPVPVGKDQVKAASPTGHVYV